MSGPTGGAPARIGEPAPDIDVAGVDGATGVEGRYRLSSERGRPVVLVFYPQDGSPVCTRQLAEYTMGIGHFSELDVTVWALSPQSVDEHRRFAAANGGFGFPLLADVDREAGEAYGVVGMLGLYRRSLVVVNADGVVGWIHRAVGPGLGYRSTDALLDAVRAVL